MTMSNLTKKSIRFIYLLFLLFIMSSILGRVSPAFAAGSGEVSGNWASFTESPEAPVNSTYTIDSAGKLAWLASQVNGGQTFSGYTFNMTKDISLSAHEWTPIGTYVDKDHIYSFDGTFNGCGYKITGLTIGTPLSPNPLRCNGLFGFLGGTNAVIKNVGIINASVIGSGLEVGGLAGYNYKCGIIENCYVTGKVVGVTEQAYVGSLVACNEGNITGCSAIGSVEGGKAATVGGLVGYNLSQISNSYTKCSVVGGEASNAGGFIGYNHAYAYNCYSLGNVTGGDANVNLASYSGGFSGYNYGNISNCFATGNVTGGSAFIGAQPHKAITGGFVGRNDMIISNCFSTGIVKGGNQPTIGGFMGKNTNKLANAYCNISKQTDLPGIGENAGTGTALGLSDSVMKGEAKYKFDGETEKTFIEALNGGLGSLETGKTYSTWVADINSINNGYPIFNSNIGPNPAVATYNVTYNGNGNEGGSVPADSNFYIQSGTAAVIGNTGNMVKAGYIFTGWNTAADGSGTTYVSGDTFNIGNSDVMLYAKWAATEVTFNIAINGGVMDKPSGSAFLLDEKITATANPAPEGKKFAYWTIGNDKVSYSPTFDYYAAGNVNITANYVDVGTDVKKEPMVRLEKIGTTRYNDGGKYSLSFIGQIVVPEGYTLQECGLVLSNQNVSNLSDLVIGGMVNSNAVKKAVSIKQTSTCQYMITLKGVPANQKRVARAYMTYKKTDDLSSTTIYSSDTVELSTSN